MRYVHSDVSGGERVAGVGLLVVVAGDRPLVVADPVAVVVDARPGVVVAGVGDQELPVQQQRATHRRERRVGAEVGSAQAGRLQFTPAALLQLLVRRHLLLPRHRRPEDAGQVLHVVAVLVRERVQHDRARVHRVRLVVPQVHRERQVDGLVRTAVRRSHAALDATRGGQLAGVHDRLRGAERQTALLHRQRPGAVEARQQTVVVVLRGGEVHRRDQRLRALRGRDRADAVELAGLHDLVDRRAGWPRRGRRTGR